MTTPATAEARLAIEEWYQLVRRETHVLRRRPALLFQQAANHLGAPSVADAVRGRLARGRESRPWLRWINAEDETSLALFTLAGNWQSVHHCAVSPDARHLLTVSDDRASFWDPVDDGRSGLMKPARRHDTLRLWDPISGRLLRELAGHNGAVTDCAFSPDGRTVMSASTDATVRLWDVSSGAALAVIEQGMNVEKCSFSLDGQWIAAAGGSGQSFATRIWSANGREATAILDGHRFPIRACRFSPDGRLIATASSDRTVKLWDRASGRERWASSDHGEHVDDCAFSPDGRRLVAAAESLRIWDVQSGEVLRELPHWAARTCVFLTDNRTVVAASERAVKIWDGDTGSEIAGCETEKGLMGEINSMSTSPDGRLIVFGCWNGSVNVWNGKSESKPKTLVGHTGRVVACTIAPDGTWLVSGADDGTARVWRTPEADGESATGWHTGSVTLADFSPDGRRVVSAGFEDPRLLVWDGLTGRLRSTLTHESAGESYAFFPDGVRMVVGTNDGRLTIWDLVRDAAVRRLTSLPLGARACACSPDASRVAAVSLQNQIRLWDLDSTSTGVGGVAVFGGVQRCVFSPNGRLVATTHPDGSVKLYEADLSIHPEPSSWRPLRVPLKLGRHATTVTAFAFAPDGLSLVTASRDRLLKIWDVRTGRELATLRGHGAAVTDCAFSPDGAVLASASEDGALKLWNPAESREVRTLTGHAGAVLGCAFSPDGRWIASTSADGTIGIWNAASGDRLCELWMGLPSCVPRWSPGGGLIAVGTAGGRVHLLEVSNLEPGAPVATPWIEASQPDRESRRQATSVHVGCPRCRSWFDAPDSALGTECACERCGGRVKLTAFALIGDWKPIAAAWSAIG